MCGIAAIFAYSPDAPGVDPQELRRINQRMVHRGPDGFGEWLDERDRAGLAHRRLSIIDLSINGAQPMLSADGHYAITFNGEIYNYQALRKGLEIEGVRFRSTSDTEVLLQLYIRRKEHMLDEVRGMYAFVIWDGVRRGIFAARDPFGIKPLYVADNGKTLRFASQVKALTVAEGVDLTPDPAGHAGFFLWGHVPEPFTLYRGIHALRPGTTFWADEMRTRRITTFASIPETLSPLQEPAPVPDPREFLREAVLSSVNLHMVADVPVGVFLSAGLDSGVVTGLAAERNRNLSGLTLGFKEFQGTPNDETMLAKKVAAQYQVQHQTVWITPEQFEAECEHLFEVMDQPSTDGVNSYFVSLAARQASVKVALSGLGGDEIFGGYPSFVQVPKMAALLRPFATAQSFGKVFRSMTLPWFRKFSSPKFAGVFEYGSSFEGAYLLRRGMFMPWELPELLGKEMAEAGWERLRTLPALRESDAGLRNPRLRVMALEMAWYMRNQLLRDADWAGMAHSIEIRVPFVDWDLFRAVARLIALGQAPTKQDMCGTPCRPLPMDVLQRPKTGFHIPVRDWIARRYPAFKAERGLRGWAQFVYHRFCPR